MVLVLSGLPFELCLTALGTRRVNIRYASGESIATELEGAILIDEDVGGPEVAVQEATGVRVLQAGENVKAEALHRGFGFMEVLKPVDGGGESCAVTTGVSKSQSLGRGSMYRIDQHQAVWLSFLGQGQRV